MSHPKFILLYCKLYLWQGLKGLPNKYNLLMFFFIIIIIIIIIIVIVIIKGN